MKTVNQSDAKLYKKARFRVCLALCAAFLGLCIYFIALYWVLNLPLFATGSGIELPFILSMVGEILAWMLIFLLLASGNPVNRYFLYGGLVLEMLLTVYIFYMGTQAGSGQLTYFAWGFLSLIKVYCLYCLGVWLKNGYWCRIFYDKTVEIYGRPAPAYQEPSRPASSMTPQQQAAHAQARQEAIAYMQKQAQAQEAARQAAIRQQAIAAMQEQKRQELLRQKEAEIRRQQAMLAAKKAEEARKAEEKKYAAFVGPSTKDVLNSIKVKVVNYPLLAMRLGLVVFLELIIFPIVAEVFKGMMMSTNGQYNFATTGIFTLCIISAAIWTVAIFFLYLKQPQSRSVVVTCFVLELLVNASYYTLYLQNYMNSTGEVAYSPEVFATFAILDLLRYPFILWAVLPVFTIPVPRSRKYLPEEPEEDLYEDYFEGDSQEETAPSLKDTLASSLETIKTKTSEMVEKATTSTPTLDAAPVSEEDRVPSAAPLEDPSSHLDPQTMITLVEEEPAVDSLYGPRQPEENPEPSFDEIIQLDLLTSQKKPRPEEKEDSGL